MATNQLQKNINAFKKRHFLNLTLKGVLITLIYLGCVLLVSGFLESSFWFSSNIRLLLLVISVCLLLFVLIIKVGLPLVALLKLNKTLTDVEAARIIGNHFPEISDRLTNLVQLSSQKASNSSLLAAALDQKTNELKVFKFTEAVNVNINLKYTYYLIGLVVVVILVSFISPSALSDGPTRILNYNKEFVKPAPFSFVVESELQAYRGEPYLLKARVEGNSLPDKVYLSDQGLKLPMTLDGNSISFNIPSIREDKVVTLMAAGVQSAPITIKLRNRPDIVGLDISIEYPSHTGREASEKINTGNFIVPEGSVISWSILSSHASDMNFLLGDTIYKSSKPDTDRFNINYLANQPFTYSIELYNQHSSNKNPPEYEVSVIKDEFPTITAHFALDSLAYQSVVATGNISDDYGFSNLNLYYRKNADPKFTAVSIPFRPNNTNQNFFIDWSLSDLNLSENDNVELYVSVYDNDGVNGPKRTVSNRFNFKKPSSEEIEEEISTLNDQSQNNLEKSIKESNSLNKKIEDLKSRLKNDQKIGWQEKKMLEDLMEERKKVEERIQNLKEQHQALGEKQKEFNKQSPKLQEKSRQLQELMNEVLDEETKKLYEELQKLLSEKSNSEEVLKQLDKIESSEKTLEKELERALELFKRMKMETLIEQAAEKLDELGEQQQSLADQDLESKTEEQKEIKESFEKIREELDEAEKLNNELKSPQSLDDINKDEEKIQEDMDDLEESLDSDNQEDSDNKPNNNDGNQNQKMKNAGEKMKNLSQKMQSMQAGAEMEMMEENIDNLRNILDNLIKLSLEQEVILKDIKIVSQLNPKFIELSQQQLNLSDNMQVVEDSLIALAGRVAQISNFVTREVSSINEHLDKAMFQLKERNKGRASSDQQFAMASMNNLALLLEDILEQMQMSMSEAMGKPQKGNKKGKSMPSISEMQKQLSQQIQELKQSGKTGRSLSEELAKLAADQAELRQAMKELSDQLGNEPSDEEGNGGAGSKLKEAIEKMELNEIDLVNKRLSQELIDRQQDILTRMLEAEESMRKQKESPERKGETAKPTKRRYPPEIEQYLKAKESEIELLKTIPLDLEPFYKKEVNEYFRRLSLPDE